MSNFIFDFISIFHLPTICYKRFLHQKCLNLVMVNVCTVCNPRPLKEGTEMVGDRRIVISPEAQSSSNVN